MKIVVVLHNIRSTYNVGAILRTADGLGVEKVVLSGYTPRYEDPKLLPHLRAKLNHQIEKSALGAEKLVKMEMVDDLAAWLDESRGLILGLENNLSGEEAERLFQLGSVELKQKMQGVDRVILVLGEEVNGIAPVICEKMTAFVEIPMYGQKESFNVSVAAGIAMWALREGVMKD